MSDQNIDITTEHGKADIRGLIQRMFDRGVIKRPEGNEGLGGKSLKAVSALKKDGNTPLSEPMVEACSELKEPFHTADIMRAANVDRVKANNTLTTWKNVGWIDKTDSGFYRTRLFGRVTR